MTWSVTQLGCRDSYLFSYEFFSCWGTRGSPATRQLLCVDRGADAQGQVPVDRGPLRLLSRGRALYQHSHVLCRDGWHRSHVAGTGVASPSTATGVARGRPARGVAPSPLPRLRDRQPPSVRRGSSCGVFIDALASSFLFPVRWELFSSLKSCLCGQRCCAHTVVAVRVPFLRLRQRELPVPLHSRASLEKSRFLLSLRFRVLIAGVSSGL